jgi:hypothetical protein
MVKLLILSLFLFFTPLSVIHLQTVDEKIRFLELVNQYRGDNNLDDIKYSTIVDTLANKRVDMIYENFSEITEYQSVIFRKHHLNYRFDKSLNWFNDSVLVNHKIYAYECSMYYEKTRGILSKDDFVDFVFSVWVSEPDDNLDLLHPDVDALSLAWKRRGDKFVAVCILFKKI